MQRGSKNIKGEDWCSETMGDELEERVELGVCAKIESIEEDEEEEGAGAEEGAI